MVYTILIIFLQKRKKMIYVRFISKVVIVYSGEEVGFDCKNNYGRGKSNNFWLNITDKINYKTLIV